MSEDVSTHLDPRDELFELAASARALVGWYEETGAWGLPASEVAFVPPPAQAPQAFVAPAPQAAHAAQEPRRAPPSSQFQAPQSFDPPQRHAAPPPQAAPAQASPQRARPEVLSPATRVERLHVLASDVADCTRCALAQTRTQTVFARGNPLAELCFVGDGPTAEDDAAGVPFVGAVGQKLDQMIGAMGYRPDEVYVVHGVKCGPIRDHKIDPAAIDACRSHLASQLDLARPKVIVALGTSATRALLGTAEPITSLRGKWKMHKGTVVMPTYHPAYVLKNADKKSVRSEAWEDLKMVMAHLGKKPPQRG